MKCKYSKFILTAIPAIFLIVLIALGCSSSRKTGWETAEEPNTISAAESQKLLYSADRHWSNRHVRTELDKALAGYEIFLKSHPQNKNVMLLLSRGHYLLADGFLETDEEKKKSFDEGARWGERALVMNSDFKKKMVDEKLSWDAALPAIKKNQLEALYWMTANLVAWTRISSLPVQVEQKNKIKHMIDRIEELDSKFLFGGANRLRGTFYAYSQFFAGGDAAESRKNFEKAISSFPQYIENRVLFAEQYAMKKKDLALYKSQLQSALQTPAESIADFTPEQIIQQKKAKKLLEEGFPKASR